MVSIVLTAALLVRPASSPEGLVVYRNGSTVYPVTSSNVTNTSLVIRTLWIGQGAPRKGVPHTPLQTHEVAFCPKLHRAYVSVLTAGQLLEFQVEPSTGFLSSRAAVFTFNSPGSGLHNIVTSKCFSGMLWVSTQYDNSVHLVDPAKGYTAIFTMAVPRLLHKGTDVFRLSEPHAVREADDCSIWVALKGNTRNVPAGPDDVDYTELYDAMTVLDPRLPRNHTDGHAVWHLSPAAYNRSNLPALGGRLVPAMPTPVMSAVDGLGNTFHAQDCTPSLLRVGADGSETQVPVGLWFKSSGPGVVAAPDGSVWVCSLTRDDGMLLRFRPGTVVPEPFDHPGSGLSRSEKRRTIHLAFALADVDGTKVNMMYVLTSSLLLPGTDPAVEEVSAFAFDKSWDHMVGTGAVWRARLPVPHSASHRIAVVDDRGGGTRTRSILVTGLLADVVYQIFSTGQETSLV